MVKKRKELGRKNIRLAIILGLVAISFYAGFFLFYADGFNKSRLMKFLQKKSLKTYPIKFDTRGMQSWKVRIDDDKKDNF